MVGLRVRAAIMFLVFFCMVEIVDACPCGIELSEEEAYFIVEITLACECGPELSVEESYLKADGIFLGKAVESRSAEFKIHDQTYPYVDYVFEVIKRYKGNVIKDKVIIRTGPGGSDCGYGFALGMEYIVYGFLFKGNLYSTNRCTRNREVSSQKDPELNILEELSEK